MTGLGGLSCCRTMDFVVRTTRRHMHGILTQLLRPKCPKRVLGVLENRRRTDIVPICKAARHGMSGFFRNASLKHGPGLLGRSRLLVPRLSVHKGGRFKGTGAGAAAWRQRLKSGSGWPRDQHPFFCECGASPRPAKSGGYSAVCQDKTMSLTKLGMKRFRQPGVRVTIVTTGGPRREGGG